MPYYGADADQYIELAEGRPENVIKPFSSRILHPIMVRMAKNLIGGTTDQGFTLVACGALVVFVSSCMLILLPEIPFLLIPHPDYVHSFLIQLTKECYLPDLFHASLVALFCSC
jgi:hypothetical protein